jgi:hypothetical protein
VDIDSKNDGIEKEKQSSLIIIEKAYPLAVKSNKIQISKSRAKIAAQILPQFHTINYRTLDNHFPFRDKS